MTIEEKKDMLCRLRSDIAVFIPRFKHQYCNTLNEIIEELEQQPKTGWIPCSERLPEENGNYLVTVEANDGTASIKFQMVDHYGPKWLHEGKREKVIAWMPLPEPYKAESEENDDGY